MTKLKLGSVELEKQAAVQSSASIQVVREVPAAKDLRRLERTEILGGPSAYYDEAVVPGTQRSYRTVEALEVKATRLLDQGWSAWHGGEYETALAVFEQLIRLVPESTEAIWGRAVCQWYLGNPSVALADYDTVLDALPGDVDPAYLADVLAGRGGALSELGRFEAALADFDKAIALNESDKVGRAYARNGRALTLAGLRRYEEALAEFEMSLKDASGNAWALFNRGLTYDWMGEHERAAVDFKAALEAVDVPLTPVKRAVAEERLRTGHPLPRPVADGSVQP